MTDESQPTGSAGGFFKTLFDQSPYAMQIYSPDGVVVKTNNAWDAFWGVSRSNAVNHYNINKDKQAQSVGLTSAFKQALAGISTSLQDVEYDPELTGLDGLKRFLNVRMLPLEQVDGQVEGIVCILEDKTKSRLVEQEQYSYRERLEREVNERTKQLEALLQFSTEILAVNDLESVYEFVTTWAKSLLKFDYSTLFILSRETGRLVMEETLGFPRSMVGSFSLLDDQGLPSLVARDRQVAVIEDFSSEDRVAIPEVIFEHNLTSAMAVPMLDRNGLIGVLIGHTRTRRIFTASDISLYQNFANQAAVAIANSRNRRSLLRSEERFRQLFESANDAIYLVDLKTRRIVDCNRKALALDGYSREEMTSMKMYELYPPEERSRIDKRYDHVVRKGSFTTVASHFHVRKDSTRIPVEISSSLVETGGQQLIMNIVRDVSRRKALELEKEATAAKLRRSSRMEALGLMAGGVAHDLNNILSGVISYPELMMVKLPKDSPVRADLKKIVVSGQRAAGVVADLLTVARGAATVKEVACVNELARIYLSSPEFCKLETLYPEVRITSRLTSDVKNILCSPVHIQKVLMNLVTNAAESIGGVGEVVVSTGSHVVEKYDAQEGIAAGEYTVLNVRDTGSGISQLDLDHIFDPFYTTKKMGRSGTGLGLAVVWNTVQDHDGSVLVKSDGEGTVFSLHFPVSTRAKSCRMSTLGDSLVGLHGKGRLLVVDDEQSQREITAKILTTLGYQVTTVGSGEEAVAFLEKNCVDLVLLDMLMEPGINGRETFEQIIHSCPGQKAIVVSGYSDSEDIKQVMKMGVLALLKKPYTMEEIGRAVRKALEKER